MAGSYGPKSDYAKYLAKKTSSTGECSGCAESSSTECSECCEPGLVAVKDVQGNHLGCLTPEDAEAYNLNNPPMCEDGNVALYDKSFDPPRFVGCVPSDEFAALNTALNPA